jgi:hypothetical protein
MNACGWMVQWWDGFFDFDPPASLSTGGFMSEITHVQIKEIENIIGWYRSSLLEAIEELFGSTPEWPQARSKILRALGDKGIQGKVRESLIASKSGAQ